MTSFNVHFTRADGTADCRLVEADDPKAATASIQARYPAALITKIKRWKAPADVDVLQIGGGA